MKLKKIAALALAGVMAVSMLAGCAGNATTDKDDTTTEVTGSATGISAQVAAQLDNEILKLADNSTYTAWLSSAVADAKLKSSDLLSATVPAALTMVTAGDSNKVKEIAQAIEDKFTYNVENFAAANTIATTGAFTAPTTKGTKVYMSLFTIGQDLSEAEAVTAVAKLLNTKMDGLKAVSNNSTTAYFDVTYTGSVSLQKVTKDDITAWFALVTVTQTATERK